MFPLTLCRPKEMTFSRFFEIVCASIFKPLFQENEQFKKQEKRRIEREKRAAEEKAKKIARGETVDQSDGKPGLRKTKKPPRVEEKCVIDSLMDEIKQGFPLRKRNITSDSSAKGPATRQGSTRKNRSRANWKKTSALASFLGKIISFDEMLLHNKYK